MRFVILVFLMSLSFVSHAEENNTVAEKADVVPQTAEAKPSPAPTPAVVAQPAEPSSAAPQEERAFRFFLGADLSSPYTIKFESGTATVGSSSFTGTAEFKLTSAAGISLGVEFMKKNSWGFNSAVIIQGKRELNSIKLTDKKTGDSTTAEFTGDKPTLQTNLIEANAIYRWDYIYFPFGLNYSIPIFKQGAGAVGTFEIEGAIGAQAGIGCHLNDHVRFELLSRAVSIKFKTQSGSSSVDYGTGITPSVEGRFKYAF